MTEHTGIDSRRLSRRANAIGESTTLAIAAEAKRMQADGIHVVSFSTGEPDFPTPELVKRAGIEAIENNFTRYVQAEGIPELRRAVAEKFQSLNDIQTDPQHVLISAGGKQSLANALLAVVDDGDEVLLPTPYWTSYPDLVRIAGGVPVLLKTTVHDRYKITPAQIQAAITPRTRAIILNSPSNPTGVMYTREEIEAIGRVIANAGIYVISDELYERIVFDGRRHFSIGSMPELRDLAVTVNGVSKAYSMTGWRIGYMCGPADVIAAATRLQSQMTSHPSTISMKAAYAALTQVTEEVEMMRAAFQRRRDLISGLMQDIPGISFPHPDGAFYLFVDISSHLGERFAADTDLARHLLQEHHIATVPGSAFGDAAAIRLSYACSDDDIVEGVARIRRGLS
ncbi:MAG TPA: pyridoxal phosphate-dependent aminotransferase [Candidatus Kapabacteria bacterium]|nr:pyridoxal phosphate-dependent aminotransferase [Candidatus Kapabacteria bacterium]